MNELDPLGLNVSLSEVDTSFPSLSVGPHQMVISNAEIKNRTKVPTDRDLVITFKTVNTEQDTKGNDINPGAMQIFYRLALQQNQAENAPDFKRQLASFHEEIYGDKNGPGSLAAYVGVNATVTMKPAKDTTYGETDVKSVKAPIA